MSTKKRILASILSMAMLLQILPLGVFATNDTSLSDASETSAAETSETEVESVAKTNPDESTENSAAMNWEESSVSETQVEKAAPEETISQETTIPKDQIETTEIPETTDQSQSLNYGDTGTYKPYPEATYELTYQELPDGTLEITGYTGDAKGELHLPEQINGKTVTVIGDRAFYDCSGFTGDLIIPDSITSIGSKHSTYSDAGPFVNCSGFTGNIRISKNVKIIGDFAFAYCTNLTGSLILGDNVQYIGREAFSDCKGLTGDLKIPNSTTEIANYAFDGCLGLTGTLSLGQNITSLGMNAFGNCTNLTGDLVIPDSVTEIGEGAFQNCSGFNGVLTIGNHVKSIGGGAFENCSGLTGELVIPDSVVTIEDSTDGEYRPRAGAFSGCTGFTGLILGKELEKIGSEAFDKCTGLTGDLIIPDKVHTISYQAFAGCTGFNGKLVLGKSLTEIKGELFSDFNFTGSLVIPESVTEIGNRAFENCTGFVGDLVIPDSVTEIGSHAFANCSGFSGNLTIGKNVTSIGSGAFKECRNFTGDLLIPDSVTKLGFSYETDETGVFEECKGFSGDLIIGDGLTRIEGRTFYGCNGFQGSLKIGNGVKTIAEDAFENCKNFQKDLIIGNSLTDLYSLNGSFTGSFHIGGGLTHSTLFENFVKWRTFEKFEVDPSNTSFAVFDQMLMTSDQTKLIRCATAKTGTLQIPDTIAVIGDNSFYKCGNLTSVSIPASVSTIGDSAFGYCSNLTSVSIPASVSTIGNSAFESCSSLTSVSIPAGVTSIGDSAFKYCRNLTSISIPANVTSISYHAFYGCSSLTDVYYGGTEDEWRTLENKSEVLERCTIHYNSTGPHDGGESGNNPYRVEYLTEWTPETRQLMFGKYSLFYKAAENMTTPGVDSVEQLVGKYVLVDTDPKDRSIVVSIRPVESKIATVQAAQSNDPHTLTLDDGTVLPVREDIVSLEVYVNQTLLLHICDGTVVDIWQTVQKTGIWEEWNGVTKEALISGKEYSTNSMTDLSFLSNIDQTIGTHVQFMYVTSNSSSGLDSYLLNVNTHIYQTKVGTLNDVEVSDSTVQNIIIDGQKYSYKPEWDSGNPVDLKNERVFFLLADGQIVHLDALKNIQAEMTAHIYPADFNVKYSHATLNKNKFNSRLSLDYSCNYSFPHDYDRSVVLAAAKIPSVQLKQISWENQKNLSFNEVDFSSMAMKAGESKSIQLAGAVSSKYRLNDKIRYDTLTSDLTVTYSTENSAETKELTEQLRVHIENLDWVNPEPTPGPEPEKPKPDNIKKQAKAAYKQLNKIQMGPNSIIQLRPDTMSSVFGIEGKNLNLFEGQILAELVMSNAPAQTFEEQLSEGLLEEIFAKYGINIDPGVDGAIYTVPLTYLINTPKYGQVLAEFECIVDVYTYQNKPFTMYCPKISYEIIDSERDIPKYLQVGVVGGGVVKVNVADFASAVYTLAESAIKESYKASWGNRANQAADIIFGETVTTIFEECDKNFADVFWNLCTWPSKNITIKNAASKSMFAYFSENESQANLDPINIYIYDTNGTLCGAIENGVITQDSDDFKLYVDGTSKHIDNLNGNYTVKYVVDENAAPTQIDVCVTEYFSYQKPLHQVQYSDIALQAGDFCTQVITAGLNEDISDAPIVLQTQEQVLPDSEAHLIVMNPCPEYTEVVVYFDANGGNTDVYHLTTENGCLSELPTPVWDENHTFMGWFTDPVDGKPATVNQVYSENTTLYAHWEKDTSSHTHTGTLVSGQAATCTADGWKDYYKCSCGKFFEDAACTNEISDLAAWKTGEGKLNKLDHTFGEWQHDDANHWHVCSCGEKNDVAPHDFAWIIDKEATETTAGTKHPHCNVCGYDGASVEIPDKGGSTPVDPEKPAEKASWIEVDGGWKYRHEDGSFHTGWLELNAIWYYFDVHGAMLLGWQYVGGNWFYMNASGHMLTDWQQISGTWYYFNQSGHMLTGWQQISGTWYYFNQSGHMLTGWQQISGTWYYFNQSGHMLTGWQQISGTWYYFNQSGHMLTGWQQISGTWYYFNQSGYMLTGWQQISGTWYYFNQSGHMLTGWQQISGSWYYFYGSGAMAAHTVIDGCTLNGSGIWVK